ncbi:MAG: cation-translocating P-type ATPase [Bryobacterales bacterium]|nr:cation-translocating P-type ATPase [Bryobacterales bacterium]
MTDAEVLARRSEFGWNELSPEAGPSFWRRLAGQFGDALVVLLLVAGGLSATVWFVERESDWPYEALVIAALVVFNAVLGLAQEGKAERAMAALRRMTAPEVTVIRNGTLARVPSRALVPGDLLLIGEGDLVPADCRLLECVELFAMEAALTGESTPVSKTADETPADAALGDRLNLLFAGTAITAGHGRAVVMATGMRTELGKIAGMLRNTQEQPTPLQRQMNDLGKQLGLAVLMISIGVSATLLWIEGVQDIGQVMRILLFGVVLAVAAAPEGLAAVVTVVLAMGVTRMAKRGAVLRKLPAVETLGSATVIASDKTGTLTRNEMTVREIITASGRTEWNGGGMGPGGGPAREEALRLLTGAALANNATVAERGGNWVAHGDPTEGALAVAARRAGLTALDLEAAYPRVGETPFTSERKWMSTVHQTAAGRCLFMKGAPHTVLARCAFEDNGGESRPLDEARRAEILAANERQAAAALRTLAVARGEGEATGGLTFLGLIGLMDPARPEAAEAVERAKAAGIRPIMITGDHPATALAIARDVGIAAGGRAITGRELDELSEADVATATVFARVNPAHKLRIVELLRRTGAVVAMTGDGVNDAPALKAADIGVAMGITGSEVTKEAADLILTDDNFATIVAAVEEGRAIYDNIRKFLRYLLSSNIGEVATIFLGVVFAGPLGLASEEGLLLPLLAAQILWINLVTDGAPALALGADPASPGLMSRRPRPPAEGVLNARMGFGVGVIGMVMAAGTLGVLDWSLPGGMLDGTGSIVYGRTMAFTTLVLFQLANAFNCRSDERSAFDGLLANGWLWASVALSLALQACVVNLPFLQTVFGTVALPLADWVLAATVASSVVVVSEGMKLAARIWASRVA